MGQKPLFYEVQKNKILFSSQVSGILQDKNFNRQLDHNSIQKFYFSSFLPAPHSPYQSIKQLKPAEIIKINLKNIEIKKDIFWNLKNGPDYNQFLNLTTKLSIFNLKRL